MLYSHVQDLHGSTQRVLWLDHFCFMLSACLHIAYMIKKNAIARRDVLCTDKTGTLTMDEVHLFKALDTAGKESLEILRLAYANSTFQASPPASPHHLAFSGKLNS